MRVMSFLTTSDYTIDLPVWKEDEFGCYWSAFFYNAKTGKREGATGSYYDIYGEGENQQRLTKEEQELFLKEVPRRSK